MPGSGGTDTELGTPGVRQVAEAALGGVQAATLLSTAVAGAQDVGTGTSTPRPLASRVPLTKLLGRRGLTRAWLVLGSPLHSSASTSSTSAASAASTPTATTTAASTSTAATDAPTSATTPTPTPSSASTATTASPATSSSTLAPLALAVAASPARSRRSTDRPSANKVDSSSRVNGGQKGNGGAPLKERGMEVTTRGSYSCNTSLCCKETLLEEVNGESGGAKREEVVPDRAKGVRESSD
ncbi:unnamed protein product [Closterium sp. NIES-54]